MTTAREFVDLALTQAGDRYVFGAEARSDDPDPDAFDCSELIEWVGARLGVSPRIPDGSWLQMRHLQANGTLVPVAAGVSTRGALLGRFSSSPFSGSRPRSSHIVISLGDGRTMEARSSAAGVGVFGNAEARGWTHAGLIPGVDYSTAPTGADPVRYTVESGDTLRGIAADFGLDDWRPIYEANRAVIGGDPDLIRPGQTLTIPAPGLTPYTVAAGDTLRRIAGRFGLNDWPPIYEANRAVIGSDPDLIHPGQVLMIPT